MNQDNYILPVKDHTVTVFFSTELICLNNDDTVRLRELTYCTVLVQDNDSGKLHYYHGGSVWNGRDRYNPEVGEFRAFKKASTQRFEEVWVGLEALYLAADMPDKEETMKRYLKHWGKVLWQVKHGKVDNTTSF